MDTVRTDAAGRASGLVLNCHGQPDLVTPVFRATRHLGQRRARLPPPVHATDHTFRRRALQSCNPGCRGRPDLSRSGCAPPVKSVIRLSGERHFRAMMSLASSSDHRAPPWRPPGPSRRRKRGEPVTPRSASAPPWWAAAASGPSLGSASATPASRHRERSSPSFRLSVI